MSRQNNSLANFKRRLAKVPAVIRQEVDAANEKSAKEWVAAAKSAAPVDLVLQSALLGDGPLAGLMGTSSGGGLIGALTKGFADGGAVGSVTTDYMEALV